MEKSLDNKSVFQALPTELLVHIFTFLLSRDKVNLRYVSRRIRYATETASLWSEFVWPYYDRRGENSVKNLLKSCGGYIKTLTFPNHVPPVNTLQCCNNVVELSIPQAKLDPEQLGNVVKHMGGLKKLDVKWTDADMMPLLSISSKLNQLTVRLTPKGEEDDSLEELLDSFLHNWAVKGCIPHYVNIVYFCFQQLPIDEWIFCSTHNWSHISSGGHTGLLKVYYNLKVPLDLYTVLPAFQLQFGCAAAPFRLVDGRMVGLVSPVVLFEDGSVAGSGFSWLCLTDCSYGGKIAFKAEFCSFRNADGIPIDENTKNLNFVTYLKVSCGWLRPDHLEQLAVTCTNLQNLLLDNSSSCLRNLQGLRAIASYCHSLQGLNLVGICATEVEDCMQLWEILSDLKLTHLGIQLCNILSFEDNDVSKRKVFNLYSKFAFLKALQFGVSGFNRTCPKCENVSSQDIFLLSYLPSLTYCALDLRSTRASDTVRDIVTSCKKLTCFHCFSDDLPAPLSLPEEFSAQNLQQLFICLKIAVSDKFMNAVSVHGGLVHVLLFVKSVGYEGIATLIMNSPKLLTFHIILDVLISGGVALDANNAMAALKKRFCDKSLFISGSFEIGEIDQLSNCRFRELLYLDTDVSTTLWA